MIAKNKVSVIVPIYKVEKYLIKCIESIINQTYSNLEIILVDDGSPDNCGKICDEYAKKDKRIKVIHKKNGGLSDARNAGTSIATGEFITYIDSDDYVSDDYIEYLYSLIMKYDADISIVSPREFYEGDLISCENSKEKLYVYDKYKSLEVMLYQKLFETSAWGKLYKRAVVENVDFPVGKIYEDIGTVYKYLLKSSKVIVSNKKIYYYLQRKDSIMGRNFREKDLDYVYQAETMLIDVSKVNIPTLEKAAISRYVSANFSVLLKMGKSKEYKNYRKKLLLNIKKYRLRLLLDHKVRFKSKVALVLSYINFF